MAAFAHADILHVGSGLIHTKSRQSCACYIAAMFDDRTYEEFKGAS